MIVVSNATCLIALSKIGHLHLLKDIFGEVHVPQAVYVETVVQGQGRLGADAIKSATWINTRLVEDTLQAALLQATLGPGEAEVIVLARELSADLVILDEKTARDIAATNGLKVIGTLGVLRMARLQNKIGSVALLIPKLKETKFWIDEELYQQVLKEEEEETKEHEKP